MGRHVQGIHMMENDMAVTSFQYTYVHVEYYIVIKRDFKKNVCFFLKIYNGKNLKNIVLSKKANDRQ